MENYILENDIIEEIMSLESRVIELKNKLYGEEFYGTITTESELKNMTIAQLFNHKELLESQIELRERMLKKKGSK